MHSRRRQLFSIIVILILLVAGGMGYYIKARDGAGGEQFMSKSELLMGTLVDAMIYAPEGKGEAALDAAFGRAREIEQTMSANLDGTDISRLNEAPVGTPVKVSPDTITVYDKAIQYSQLTDGEFDPTIGRLVKLWGIGTDRVRIPSRSEIESALSTVGYKDGVSVSGLSMTRLRDCAVDLGAIAKGYASDEMVRVLERAGVHRGLISLGGNIYAFGLKPDGRKWSIGIQDPFLPRNEYLGIVSVTDTAVVTSGDYERFFEVDGVRYHHILDPDTGYPVDNDLRSVSIVTKSGIDADGLSTSLFMLGSEKAIELAKALKDVEAILVTKDRKVIYTKGLEGVFTPTSEDYAYEAR